jgi:hypothetical protein
MTTGIPREQAPIDLRMWAAVKLDIGPVEPESVRQALLRRLPEDEFVPPLEWQQAAAIAGVLPAPVAPPQDAVRDMEDCLSGGVEKLAEQFFTLPPDQRRQRWQEEYKDCAGSLQLAAWLHALEPGLAVEAQQASGLDPKSDQLAQQVLQLFPCRPAERAARRHRFLQGLKEQAATWEAAARRLARTRPALAALEPVLIEYLTDWGRRQKQLAKARRKGRKRAALAGAKQSEWGSFPWVAFVLVFALLRAFLGGSSSSPPRTYAVPTVRFDQRDLLPRPPRNPTFEPATSEKEDPLRSFPARVEPPFLKPPSKSSKKFEFPGDRTPHEHP